jgi:hypothetical protein
VKNWGSNAVLARIHSRFRANIISWFCFRYRVRVSWAAGERASGATCEFHDDCEGGIRVACGDTLTFLTGGDSGDLEDLSSCLLAQLPIVFHGSSEMLYKNEVVI